MRKAAVVAVCVVAALVVFVVSRPQPDAGRPPTPAESAPPPAVREDVPAAAAEPPPPGSAGQSPSAAIASTTAASDEVPSVAPSPRGLDLTVVDDRTGAALAGVDVGFLTFGGEPTQALREAMRRGDDQFTLTREHGKVVTTGRDGRAQLPAPSGHTLVAARSGELEGTLWLHEGQASERLALHRPVPLTVLVVDAAGQPCPGVRVLVVLDEKYGRSPSLQKLTGEGGSAAFTDVAARLRDSRDATLGVTLALAVGAPPYARLDVNAPPQEPVRLVLPACGTVRCDLVDAAGEPQTDVVSLRLRVPRDAARKYFVQDVGLFDDAETKAVAGVARFSHVGLGLELEVEAHSRGGSRSTTKQRFRGPSVPGEETVVRVVLGAAAPVVVGRLVDARGSPIANLQLFADVVEPGHTTMDMGDCKMSCTSTTDAEGRFRFALDREPGDSPSARLHLGRIFRGERGSWGVRGIALADLPSSLPGGDTSVGDVVYRGTEVLAEGVVVGHDGNPLEGVCVAVMERSSATVRAPSRDVEMAHTDAQGRFRLCGDTSRERLEIGAQLDGWYVEGDELCVSGARDVHIEMRPAGGIAGTLRLPEGMSSSDVEVCIRGEPQRNGDIGYRFGVDGIRVLVNADGSFEERSLRPGVARVVVRLDHNRNDELLAIDVPVKAGEVTRDPRLAGFDLAAKRQKLVVSVVDADRRPLAGALVHYRSGKEYWRELTTGSAGTVSVPAESLPVELIVTCNGQRHETVAAASADATVMLTPGTRTVVRVRLADDVRMPDPPHSISARLVWLDPAHSPRESLASRPLDLRNFDDQFGKERTVSFETWDRGTYRVGLMLRSTLPGGGSAGSEIDSAPSDVVVTVSGEGGVVEAVVSVDAEALAARTSGDR